MLFPLKEMWSKLVAVITGLAGKRKMRRGVAAVVFFVAMTLLVAVELMPYNVNLVVGQVSPTIVKAQRSITFEDKDKTQEAHNLAAARVEKQYIIDPRVSVDVQKNIAALMSDIAVIQKDQSLDEAQKIKKLREVIPFQVSDEALGQLTEPGEEHLNQVKTIVNNLVVQAMEAPEGVSQENLNEVESSLLVKVAEKQLASPYDLLATDTIRYFLRPNKFVDLEKTQRLQQAAREAVPPIMVSIKEGEKIIGEGEIVTEEHITKLEALGLSRSALPMSAIAGSALLVALLMLVVLFYLYQQNVEIYRNAGHLYLLGMIALGVMGISKAIIAINVTQWPEFGALLGYLAPMAAAGMLIAILLDSRLAVLVVAVLSFLLGLMTGGQIRFAVVGLVGGLAGIYGVSKLSQRGDLARAGFYSGAANILVIFAMGLVSGTPIALTITSSLILGTLNGILSSILTNGTIPYLESAFGITSSVRLLELSNPGNPLLRRLQLEAPGTYHHSLMVGNLAEAAADAVQADSLLVRVAAYYHDIGKIKRPYFFIENQLGGDNPHDKIAPTLSTLILNSHVKDGVELAREHKLPQGIVDIIEQHHGESMCSFFYHKAMEDNKLENINQEDFRYEGPKPQTKEAAIVMLADAVEAAVKSMQDSSPGRIEGMVRKIIKDKLMDGQLDECDLTLKDLDNIATAFIRVITGTYHRRIEYPDVNSELERRKKRRAGARKQLTG